MRTDRGKAAAARLRAWVDRIRAFGRSRSDVADPTMSRVRLTVLVSLATGLLAVAIVAAFAGPSVRSSTFGGLISTAVSGAGVDAGTLGGTLELQPGAAAGGDTGSGGGATATPPPGPNATDGQPAQQGGSSPAPGLVRSSDTTGILGGNTTLSSPAAQPTPVGGPTATPGETPSTPMPTAEPPDATALPTPAPTFTPTATATPAPTAEPTPTTAPPDPTAEPTPTPSASASTAPACSDGIDNDGDGLVDLLDVLGCIGPLDNDETNVIL